MVLVHIHHTRASVQMRTILFHIHTHTHSPAQHTQHHPRCRTHALLVRSHCANIRVATVIVRADFRSVNLCVEVRWCTVRSIRRRRRRRPSFSPHDIAQHTRARMHTHTHSKTTHKTTPNSGARPRTCPIRSRATEYLYMYIYIRRTLSRSPALSAAAAALKQACPRICVRMYVCVCMCAEISTCAQQRRRSLGRDTQHMRVG